MSHRPRPRSRAWAATLLAASMMLAMPVSPAVSASPARPQTARVVAEERIGPRLVDLTIQSPALGTTAKVRLLTPDGWERRSDRDRWPVLYLLHGVTGDHTDWTDDSDVETLRELRDVLVVMPDAEDDFYTDWWNHGAGGPPAWETFHLDELTRLLERGYGAGNRRAVAGLSMGGYGALAYAARRPGVFRAAASYSGPVHLLHPVFVASFREAVDPAKEAGLDLLAIWGDPDAQRPIWRAHDPYHLAKRLRPIPVYLSSGDGTAGPLDAPGTADDPIEAMNDQLNRSLANRLRRASVPVTTHFTPGTHSPPYWERELHRSLPMLLRSLHR